MEKRYRSIPARSLPPADIVIREIQAQNLSIQDLPEAIGRVVSGEKISQESAIFLAEYLGGSSQMWLNLQKRYETFCLEQTYRDA